MTVKEFEAIKPGDVVTFEYTDNEVYNFSEAYYMKVIKVTKTATGWNVQSDYIVAQYESSDEVDYGVEYDAPTEISLKHITAFNKRGGDIFKRHLVQDIFEKKHVFYKGDRIK